MQKSAVLFVALLTFALVGAQTVLMIGTMSGSTSLTAATASVWTLAVPASPMYGLMITVTNSLSASLEVGASFEFGDSFVVADASFRTTFSSASSTLYIPSCYLMGYSSANYVLYIYAKPSIATSVTLLANWTMTDTCSTTPSLTLGTAVTVTLNPGVNFFTVPVGSPAKAQQYAISASSAFSSLYFYANAFGVASLKANSFSSSTMYIPRVSSGSISVMVVNNNGGSSPVTGTLTVSATDAAACMMLMPMSTFCTKATYNTIPTASNSADSTVASIAATLSGCQLSTFTTSYCSTTYPMCDSNNFVMSLCTSACVLNCPLTLTISGVAQTTTFTSNSQCMANAMASATANFGSSCFTYSSAFSLMPKGWMLALISLFGLFGVAML